MSEGIDKVEDISIEVLNEGWVVTVSYSDSATFRKSFVDHGVMMKFLCDMTTEPMRVS